ncbi:uncharacterized protein L201_006373 [Kwoniella dendrophila CBS 6074]|uniref:Apple domain-containing protein n=1 Tax=Kwoniella dendrophila CBS 6074 TaxID=1295534 RepID=A0AAX4K1H6_9TREE
MRLLILTLLLSILSTILAFPTNPISKRDETIKTSLFSKFASFLSSSSSSSNPNPDIYYGEDNNGQEDNGEEQKSSPNYDTSRKSKTSSKYLKCFKESGKERNGFARYSGWKLIGDDLSGPLPVSPRDSCVTLCNAYGDACQGIFFDEEADRCYLKGSKSTIWKFIETDNEEDSINLVGGCAAWSQTVPEEMDDICCRD